MSNKIDVPEGFTYDYIVHAFVVTVVAGGLAAAFSKYIFGIGLIVAVLLVVIQAGLEVDPNRNAIRRYKNLLGLRFGKWFSLTGVKSAELHLHQSETSWTRHSNYSGGQVRDSIGSQSFDLIFLTEGGDDVLFNEFIDYDEAVDCMKALETIHGLEVRDLIKEAIHEKRRQREAKK